MVENERVSYIDIINHFLWSSSDDSDEPELCDPDNGEPEAESEAAASTDKPVGSSKRNKK